MSKARTLADFISDGSEFADGTISVAEVSGAAPLASPTFTGTVTVPTLTPTTITGGNISGDVRFGTNVNAIFGGGASDYLNIYSDGTNKYIQDTGSGSLFIRGSDLVLEDASGYDYIAMSDTGNGGSVAIKHSGDTKFITSTTGVDITGEVKADKFTNDEALPDVRPSLLLDFANSKTLDPRITFTRGSTATYWDGHTTTKAEENLITYSQDIVAGNWNITQLGVVDNQTAPDGTSTAQLFTPNTNHNYHYVYTGNSPITTAPNTFSVYAKNNGANYAFLRSNTSGGYCGVNFDLSNSGSAAVEGPGNIDSYSATDVGNGWYRLTVTFNKTLAPQTQLLINGNNTNVADTYNGNGTDGIYFWGAQLENRSSVTAYTATTSSPIVKYQPTLQTAASGEARFDHDPVTGESKGLLIEEARTNYDTYSDFSNAYGTSRVNYYADYAIAPDGTQSAIMIEVNEVGTVQGLWSNNYTTSSGTYYTTSVHVRKETNPELAAEFQMYIRNSIGSGSVYGQITWDTAAGFVAFSGGSATNATYKAEDLGDWWRLSITTNEIPTGDERTSFRMNGEPLGKRIILWGRQWEEGAFPTSYIPTSGSTVTRSKDLAVMTGTNFSDWYTPNEGTVFTDVSTAVEPSSAKRNDFVQIHDNTDSNSYYFGINSVGGSGIISLYNKSFNANDVNITVSVSDKEVYRAAYAYEKDNFAFSVDGSIGTDTSASILYEADRLNLGSRFGGANLLNGCLKKVAIYPQRLSNATLQAMTEE